MHLGHREARRQGNNSWAAWPLHTLLRAPQRHTVGGQGAELSPPPAARNKALTSWAVSGPLSSYQQPHGEGALLPISERQKLKFREMSDPFGSCSYLGVWQTPPVPGGRGIYKMKGNSRAPNVRGLPAEMKPPRFPDRAADTPVLWLTERVGLTSVFSSDPFPWDFLV